MQKNTAKTYEKTSIANLIDHTLLRSDAVSYEIERVCQEAIQYGFAAVCINPIYVKMASDLLLNTKVKVCTVIGFPTGAVLPSIKKLEAEKALSDGAQELDMVIAIGALKEKKFKFVSSEIEKIASMTSKNNSILKVIIETALLTDAEKITACKIIADNGGNFVKTSTGFTKSGATIEDVKLLKQHSGKYLKVKASGGIRTFEQAVALVNAGADRIGTSASIDIISKK